MVEAPVKAPFPWFGGKSRVAPLVWDYLGDPPNYVEPFAGSIAVLLGRPTEPRIETVNDLDCLIPNFWRAIQHDPEQVAHWADYPVMEADLHARHTWLVSVIHTPEWRERMKTEPEFYDAKVAGWWVWGISMWIGSGWCNPTREMDGPSGNPRRGRPSLNRPMGALSGSRGNPARAPRGVNQAGVTEKRPFLSNHGGGMGVHSKRPRLGAGGRGVNGDGVARKMPDCYGRGGKGVAATSVWQQLPDLTGRTGARGCMSEQNREEQNGIYSWFEQLSSRLRRVRICCGDWKRVLGPAPTTCIGTTAVFLDPPYAVEDRADVYGEESREVAHEVREWAIEHGENPQMRIALCGYEGEHKMPQDWTVVKWKAQGGYANNGTTGGLENAKRERIWFSPYCLTHPRLF